LTGRLSAVWEIGVWVFGSLVAWAPAGFFSRGGQIKGRGDESPPAGSMGGAQWGLGAKPLEADEKL